MILQCPECNSRFMVADSLIPAEGRMVRCGKCQHQWHVTHKKVAIEDIQTAAPEPEYVASPYSPAPEIAGMSPGSNVPVVHRKPIPVKPFQIAVPVLAVAWMVLAIITYSHSWLNAPVLSGIYHMFGSYPTDGLIFADVNMEREQEGSKARFIISGSILNQAATTRKIPTVRVVLKNKQGSAVWKREYPVNVQLKAGEPYAFRIANIETSFTGNLDHIELDLGNSMQLMMR